MEIACAATIFMANAKGAHLAPTSAADFAKALGPLSPLYPRLAETIFALGILNAGLFTATVLPLSTAYIICEAMGFEAAVDRKFSEAPVFFVLFAAGLIIGAATVLIPGIPLLQLILIPQVLQGVLLPAELVLMLIIINRKSVMGIHTNGVFGNVIGWGTTIVIGALSLYYVAGLFIPQLLGG
jgi:Mn2+/Fe2+ NRAMP family transporter